MGHINRVEYPELNKLLWDTKMKFLDPQYAMEVYERRWRFVDEDALTKNEIHLIGLLTAEVGGHVPLHA